MPHPAHSQLSRAEALSLAAALTILAATLPFSWYVEYARQQYFDDCLWLSPGRFSDLVLIAVGLMLTLPAPRASGLRIGRIREHGKGVALVIGVPILLTAIVYPRLSDRPFAKSDISIWLTSPLAQDLIFGGVIYRILRPHFSARVHPALPFEWVLPIGGLFFAAWHLQNFAFLNWQYVVFQLVYTWAAYTFVGLTRQWTGSLLYVTLAHMAGNFIAWAAD
jgi:membrane protease YdiL (CAAX protease family)